MTPLATLPRRVLTEAELTATVADMAAERELWSDLVRADPERRTFHRLHEDEHLTVWLICWMAGHDTGFHDHDESGGALTVVAGALREERMRVGEPLARTLRAGDGVAFSPSTIHRVSHARGEPAVSLHAYSPPLRTMGSYSIDGELRRLALGDDDELRTRGCAPRLTDRAI
jgi:predicted metal-dependent enzyme (double-stranded beta helix superfamily)